MLAGGQQGGGGVHLFCGEYVGALYVSVHNTLVMQIRQALENLSNVHCHKRLWEGTKLGWLNDAGQGAILHKLKYDIQVGPGLERAQVLHYVLVIEIFEQLYFAHYTLKVFLRNAAERHLFDRNSVSRSGVKPLVHLAVCAPAKLFAKHIFVTQDRLGITGAD